MHLLMSVIHLLLVLRRFANALHGSIDESSAVAHGCTCGHTKESFQLMTSFQAVILNLLLEQTGSTNTDKLYDVEVQSC